MSAALLQFLLVVFAGWVNRHQAEIVAYLQEENRVCVSSSAVGACASPTPSAGGSPRRAAPSSDAEQLAGLVTPDTILCWYRELVAKKYDGTSQRQGARPGTAGETIQFRARAHVRRQARSHALMAAGDLVIREEEQQKNGRRHRAHSPP
jgi:hypothetical protein